MRSLDQELTPEERDALIERIATGIIRRGMETPAVLFLEMHKPLSFMASQGLVVTAPLIAPILGFDKVQMAGKLMEDRGNIERLIRRIEELASQKRGPEGK